MKNIIITIALSLILNQYIYSQVYDPYDGMHCEAELSTAGTTPFSGGGAYKPERTDLYPGTTSNSVFQILIVFIEFKNDSVDMNNVNWPSNVVGGSGPIYKDSLLSLDRNNNTNWWNAYGEKSQTLSDYWMETSRGHNHVVGKSYYFRLDSNANYYQNNQGASRINSEIYGKLDTTSGLNWANYDRWTYKDGTYKYEEDGKIDMIYTVYRTYRPNIGVTPGSIAILYPTLQGNRYVVSSGDTIVCQGCECIDWKNSGCTYTPGAPGGSPASPISKDAFLALQAHEIGHYHFGGCHASYGIMAGGNCWYFTGLDSKHSPWEAIKLGYGISKTATFTNPSNILGDFSSRDANDTIQVLKVPISGSDEFFLIALRNNVSLYDKIMLGDTAHDNPYRVINSNYGKGVYIYHTPDGFNWYPRMDQECADGLYDWTQNGTRNPDWSTEQTIAYYIKSSVSYDNDVSDGSLNNNDEKSIGAWFGIGKKHVNLGDDGTDRIYSNDTAVWTKRAWKGDRWDGWNVGYNEMFSPYSSPSTKSWNNSETGIYVYLYENSSERSNTVNFKIYKEGSGFNRDSILHLTPPSRPMGIVVDYYIESENYTRPIITWNHNKEPDMLRTDLKKRYKIWRATQSTMAYVPTSYTLLKTLDIDSGTAPSYIDTSIIALGSGWAGMGEQIQYPVRYTVQAIDKYADSSVRSDFGSAIGLLNCGNACASTEDNILSNNQLPKEYSVNQNYPNPFNPSTNIQYEIPFDNFVSIKIYNLLGKEVMSLINDFKKAGSYNLSFDGSNLPSGVYYYKITAGNFEQVKKMILVK
ncbi:MAG: T9SS type A sorting domain-containing protein [Bacteroidetes bacterium]|nr:T9SS type A sorting domain-containing protein [Bacteroidota bacterium]